MAIPAIVDLSLDKEPARTDVPPAIVVSPPAGTALHGRPYVKALRPATLPSETLLDCPHAELSAIVADGDRRERLKRVAVPSLVIHGEADPLVPLPGGQDTAAYIPGAKLKTFPGMGHDLPLELVDPMADAIAGHAMAATPGR